MYSILAFVVWERSARSSKPLLIGMYSSRLRLMLGMGWVCGCSIDGMDITVDGILAGTGMELKHDPGVPFAYAGFGGTTSGLGLTSAVGRSTHDVS